MSEMLGKSHIVECFEQLEEKESIINGISDALMLLDVKSYRILDVNQAFLDLYGLDGSEVIGRKCHEVTHHLSKPCHRTSRQVPCPLVASVKSGSLFHTEHVHQNHEGEDVYFEITAYPLKDNKGRVSRIIHLSRDVTDRKRVEEALRESSERIKLFAYSVVHDLKSPAIGIYGLTKILHKKYGDVLDEKGRTHCEQILKAAEQVVELVEKINVFISTKEAPLSIQWINLTKTLQMLEEEFAAQLELHQIKWTVSNSTHKIKADKLSIMRMLRNLVENSIKYGGENLSEIRIGCHESKEFHVFSVEDNGIGLKEQDSERIFRLFERTRSEGIEGSGLGLAIVKEIAKQHKGKVWAKRGRDRGIIFHVSISKEL